MTKWTDDQLKAINDRGKDILVSAAAGSGKTTILIERILRELKGDKLHEPEDIDNLLVATFTEAAAQEMKEKLLRALKKAVNETTDPTVKKHLQKQIFRVPMANISTLHAFCLSVIKKFYYVIELDPNFRLLSDDTEKLIIQEQAYSLVRDSYYEKADPEFLELTGNFTDDRSDDGLKDIIFKIYDFAITNRDTDAWLQSLGRSYEFDDTFVNTDFYRDKFIPQVKLRIKELLDKCKADIDFLNKNNDIYANSYSDLFKAREDKVEELYNSLSSMSYAEIRDELGDFTLVDENGKKMRKHSVSRDVKPEELVTMKAAGKLVLKFKSMLDKVYADYFLCSESEVNQSLVTAQKLISKLVEVEINFMKKFDELKTNRHVLDFNDLEHKAVDILNGSVDGHKIAQEFYQNKFHELMIDEYQDVNEMQDKIIGLLKCDNNHRFMVGDIKQSIYGFRQAAPQLFTDKFNAFQEPDNPNELVQLSKNFRSSKAVDDFVNNIFFKIFDKKIGDIDYDDKTKLITGTKFPGDDLELDKKEHVKTSVDTENELIIYAQTQDEDDKNAKSHGDSENHQVNDDGLENSKVELTKRQTLIAAAAKRIHELIDSGFEIYDSKLSAETRAEQVRPIKYSDIAILARTRSNNTDIVSYFSKDNIPVMVTDAKNYFQTTELQIMMAMLNVVDNPYQDIPLVAVLRSPIVGMNEEQLAEIRLADKRNTYFTAIQAYLVSDDTNEVIVNKLKSFLLQLESYREFSNKNSIARLIWKIYQETGILQYVAGMPGGKQRAANLHALYQHADTYEENNFKGLHQFIDYIQRMQDLKKDLAQSNSIEANDDTVKVMTVHGSKGLEFPIVIYLDIANNFNMKDVYANNVFDSQEGIGVTISDVESRIRYRLIQRQYISYKKKISTISEEMRLLYVALTRAKQKLIMLGYTSDSDTMFQTWNQVEANENGLIDESYRAKAKSFQDLIGMSTLKNIELDENNEYYNDALDLKFKLMPIDTQKESETKIIIPKPNYGALNSRFKSTVDNILDFDYKYQKSVETTAYQSVSEIKELFADPVAGETADFHNDGSQDKSRYNLGSFDRPQFLTKTKKITNAQIGSATHLILQKIDLEKTPTLDDFTTLITDLVNDKTFTQELADKIDVQSLADLYQTDLGQEIIKSHEQVSREFPVSILMSADKMFKNDVKDYSTNDKILVHGIIDGVIELADGIKIFDYKTDHVTDQNKAELISKYSGQINLYAEAISVIKNKPVVGKYLCFLKTNEVVNLLEK